MNGRKGFTMTPVEHMEEIRRRYDICNDKVITRDEGKEWVFCFAPFLDDYEMNRLQSPVSLADTLCEWQDPDGKPELESDPESEETESEPEVDSEEEDPESEPDVVEASESESESD